MDTARIPEYNRLVFSRLADYINNRADFITAKMTDETAKECRITKDEAFLVLISGALDLYDCADIRRYYMSEIFRQLDPEKYENNPYMRFLSDKIGKTMKMRRGKITLGREKYKPYQVFVYDDPTREKDGRIIPHIGYFDRVFEYPILSQDGREWMTVTPNEVETMEEPINAAFGNVATYGLGLGYFVFMCSEKPEVEEITAVESDPDVIELFKTKLLPYFPHKEKIRIVKADAFGYAADNAVRRHDYVFADIWHDPSDGVEAYRKLKKYERRDVTYAYWIEKTLKFYM